ncbi:DUF86 domain-containing protein [Thermosipho ferrireducens]|uniref:DUF86 domain-containing protein n=1 Tax=Thermosipho ferrireducens TaxID=2571116 RepID=A0ABX7S946_9BACT|nr:DUF86 domain-containing protein [Thermosipho ferrireducens]QTA38390.1 DUF86 domain-containing protein [Thermosipho ferrireducens]
MSKRGDREFLLDILEACRRIERYVNNLNYDYFQKNYEKQDAVIRNIEIIGEAAKNVSTKLKNKYTEIDWKKIAGMRDKLIHFYFGIKLEIVWVVVQNEIPLLKRKIFKILKELEEIGK